MTKNRTLPLVECAIMIALATVLSMVKLAELPYGGSITIASMLPIAIIAYRRGMGWGLGSAFVYAVIQQLLGLNSLSYVTTWQSVVAVILLDYIVAFTVVGFAGIFRNAIKSQAAALTLGCGAIGGSATSENVGPMNLLNLKHVAYGLREMEEIRGAAAKEQNCCGAEKKVSADKVDEIVAEIIARIQSAK